MNTPSQTIRKFSLTSFKFFLAGKGISVQTGKYFAESILVGLVAGLVVVAFRYLINIGTKLLMEDIGHHKFLSTLSDGAAMREMFSSEAFLDPYRWLMVIMPPIGALTGYMMIRKFASLKHARGTDSAIHAFHYEEGVIPGVVVPVSRLQERRCTHHHTGSQSARDFSHRAGRQCKQEQFLLQLELFAGRRNRNGVGVHTRHAGRLVEYDCPAGNAGADGFNFLRAACR